MAAFQYTGSMPAHLVFISLFLGIVSGKQMVELQADPAIQSIRILLANQEIARLTEPPWRQEIDLGKELVPRELTAIGYDGKGEEIARATQLLNLPRPPAEIEFVREGNFVQLRWSNLEYKPPRSAKVTFDGAPLRVDREFRVQLPKSDDTRPHVVAAEMRFDDGVIARREAVIEGNVFSDTAETQLTPIVLRETSKQHPASYEGCFSMPVAAVDKEDAHVIFVKDADASDLIRALDPAGRAWNMYTKREIERLVRLDDDTTKEILWPFTQRFASNGKVSQLFEHSDVHVGLIALLTHGAAEELAQKTQYSDAVAVAGVRALEGGRRRAVVFVLNERTDSSMTDPREVRRYLDAIGVPLFVWSASVPSRIAMERWGTIDIISNIDSLRGAAARLRATLASERIAWVRAPALDALQLKVDERCGFSR